MPDYGGMIINVETVYGEMVVEPIKYEIVSEDAGPWWWRQKQYYVKSDYGRLGPFSERIDAIHAKKMMMGE